MEVDARRDSIARSANPRRRVADSSVITGKVSKSTRNAQNEAILTSAPPRQECAPAPNATCGLGKRVKSRSWGSRENGRIAIGRREHENDSVVPLYGGVSYLHPLLCTSQLRLGRSRVAK